MSEQAIVDFFKKVSEDESLKNEVNSIFANNKGITANQPLAEMAVKHGYEVTAEEMEQLHLAIKAQKEKSDEISEEELESVSGGIIDHMIGFGQGMWDASKGVMEMAQSGFALWSDFN